MNDGSDPSVEDQEKLARDAKGGDREARNSLYFRYERLLRLRSRRARRIAEGLSKGVGPLLGEDVDQQCFILFCELLDSWEPASGPFREHLGRGAGWRALHYVRRSLGYRRRRRVVRLAAAELDNQMEPESESAARDLERIEGRVAWQSHAEPLDERWQRLIKMKFDEELTTAEIAVIDGHSRRAVNRELRSAINAVRAQIEEWWEDCG